MPSYLPATSMQANLDRGMELDAVVVEGGDRIHDLPAQLLELQRVVAHEVGLEPA